MSNSYTRHTGRSAERLLWVYVDPVAVELGSRAADGDEAAAAALAAVSRDGQAAFLVELDPARCLVTSERRWDSFVLQRRYGAVDFTDAEMFWRTHGSLDRDRVGRVGRELIDASWESHVTAAIDPATFGAQAVLDHIHPSDIIAEIDLDVGVPGSGTDAANTDAEHTRGFLDT